MFDTDEQWLAGDQKWICGCHGIVWPDWDAKEAHKIKIVREKRHLAAFFGDCGIQSCDVCHCECTEDFICDFHGGPEISN